MANQPVYTGFWVDRSYPLAVGATITLPTFWGNVLVAAISTVIGITGERAWTLLAFLLHQWRAKGREKDVLHFEQSVLLRNPGTALSSMKELAQVGVAWRRQQVHAKRRTSGIILLPLLLWLFFTIAGPFSALVASGSGEADTVLLKETSCGFFEVTQPDDTSNFYSAQKQSNDSRTARQYSSNCYGKNRGTLACTLLPVQHLPYDIKLDAACPFRGVNRCVTGANGAIALDTGFLDSHDHLGINTKSKDRIQFRKVMSCAVIHTSDNEISLQADSLTGGKTQIAYWLLGPIQGVSNYTFSYAARNVGSNIGYTVNSLYSGPNYYTAYSPIADLALSNADTSLHYMAANGLKYEQQNTDPFYSATELWDDTSDPELSGKYYVPDHWISIMGCTEAYQYRVASTNATTDLNGVKNTSFQALGLTPAQQATLDRISFALLPSTAYATVAGQQGNALQAQDLVNNLLAPPLPSTQWQSEVIRWFETGLANIPQQIVNYPNNAWAQGRTAQPIVVSPRDWKGREVDALVAQCGHQRIRLVGSYLNFSFLGICIIASVSIVIVTLSFAMESILFKSKKWKANGSNWHKRVAHDADNKLNLLRQTLESRGYSDWQGGFKDVPVRGHADDHEMQVLPPRHDDDDLVRYPGRPHAQGGFRDEPVGQLDDDHDLQVLDHRRDYEAVRHQPVVHAQDAEQAPYLPAGQGQAPPDAGPAGAANASGSQRHNIAGHPVPSIVTQRGTYSDDEHGQGYQNLRARPGHNRQTSESHIGASYQADVLDEASSEQDANHLAQPGLARNPASQSSDAPLLGRQ